MCDEFGAGAHCGWPLNERGETRVPVPVSSLPTQRPIKTLAIIFGTTLSRDEPGAVLIEVLLPYSVRGETLTPAARHDPGFAAPTQRPNENAPRQRSDAGASLGQKRWCSSALRLVFVRSPRRIKLSALLTAEHRQFNIALALRRVRVAKIRAEAFHE